MPPDVLWMGALVCGLACAVWLAARNGLDPWPVYKASVCAIAAGWIGSHWLGLAERGGAADAWAWVRFWTGGKSFYGGLVAGTAAAMIAARALRLGVLRTADVLAPAVALGYAIGRVGCFLNGDDFGIPADLAWSVRYPPGTEAYAMHLERGWIEPGTALSAAVHPVQLYEALAGLVLFFITLRVRTGRAGERLCVFAALYGVTRFFLELLRADSRALAQLFSLGLLCAAISVWMALRAQCRLHGQEQAGGLFPRGNRPPACCSQAEARPQAGKPAPLRVRESKAS